jgi:hypothetical protein
LHCCTSVQQISVDERAIAHLIYTTYVSLQ